MRISLGLFSLGMWSLITLFAIGSAPWKSQGESMPLVEGGAIWKYNDSGTNLGMAWRANGYDDTAWPDGRAELGFGDVMDGRPEATLLSNRQQVTFYFRKSFSFNESGFTNLLCHLLSDDGAVVYLNGTEVWRDNLPPGEILSETRATTGISASQEGVFLVTNLSPALLLPGTNWLAVEVHQVSPFSSTDLSFDLSLTGVGPPSVPALSIVQAGSFHLLHWATNINSFRLYAGSDLTSPVTWKQVTNAPTLSGNQWQVTLPAPNVGSRYFRLERPE